MKRVGRLLITIGLGVVILLQLAYLGRGLAEEWICRKIEAALFEATGSEVVVQGLGGNWLNHIAVEDLDLVGPQDSLLQSVEGLKLDLWFSPLELLAGDLAGLRSCRVTARSMQIRTDGELPKPEAEVGTQGEDEGFALGNVARLFPEGARLEVENFSYGDRQTVQSGALLIRVEPGTGRRRVRLDHAGVRADLSLRPEQREGLATVLAVEDPGHILRCFGIENELRGGDLGLVFLADLEPLQVLGTLHLSAMGYGDREIAASRVSWLLDPDILHVHKGALRLAGVSLQTAGLLAPSPLGSAGMPVEALRGDLNLDITDLSPYVDVLPELRDWLPLRGRLQTWVDGGRMHIANAWMETEGARLGIRRGDIDLVPLLEGAAPENTGELEFDLQVSSPRAVEIPGVGELTTSGFIRGTLSGNLTAPQLAGQLELGSTSLLDFRAERLSSAFSYSEDRIRLTGLNAFGLGIADARGLSRLEGQVELDLGEGTSLEISVRGQASSDWMSLLDVADPILSSVAAPSFTLTGEADLGGELPIGNAELSVTGLELAPHPPAELSASLALSEDGQLLVESASVRGPLNADLSGSWPLEGGQLVLSLRAPEQDLAFLASFLPGDPVQGTFSLDLDAEGTPDALGFGVGFAADVSDGIQWLEPFWPAERLGPLPGGPGHLDLRVRQSADGIEVDRISVDTDLGRAVGTGYVPLRWNPASGISLEASDRALDLVVHVSVPGPEGTNLPVSMDASASLRSADLQVEDLRVAAGPGSVSGSLSLGAGWGFLLNDPGESPTLGGELELEELSLGVFSADALGLSTLDGTLSGHASLAGTLDRPEPTLELGVADATIRVGSAPRLEDLEARLTLLSDRIGVQILSGTMGAGPLRGELTVQSQGNLWELPLDASIEGKLRGSDVLLANERNLRLRGNVDLEVAGSLDEIRVGGTVQITNGRYARRLTLLPDLQARGGETSAALGELRLLPIASALGQRIHLDVGLRTARDFQVRTHVLDADLVCDLRLRGQASLASLQGVVSSSAGILRLPGSTLRLDSALVTFPSDTPVRPLLAAQASGRRYGVQVRLDVNGPLASPEIQISSIPALEPQALWTLVTTGVLPENLREMGPEGQAALVGTYLAEELAAWYTGGETMEDSTSFLDRFTFVAGKDISDSGQESLVVEFALSDRFYLQGERDVYERYNGGIVLRFRF